MTLYLEIFFVIIAVSAVFVTGISALRSALGFSRTLRAASAGAAAKIFLITRGASTAQERAHLVAQEAPFLQLRLGVLRATLGKMWVLVSALGEARHRFDPFLDYLGL